MDKELLVLPERVISLRALSREATKSAFGENAIMLVTSNSVALVKSTGEVMSTITTKDIKNGNSSTAGTSLSIVDAEYLPVLGSVLLALSNASLVHVPLFKVSSGSDKALIATSIDASAFERCLWLSQPISITAMESDGFGHQACLVRCQNGNMAVISLSKHSEDDSINSSSSSSGSGSGKLPRCPSGDPPDFQAPVLLSSAGTTSNVCALVGTQNKAKNVKQPVKGHRLFSWQNAKGWLTEQTSICSDISIQPTERALSLFVNAGSALIVVQTDDASSSRFIKTALDATGGELFCRLLGRPPLHSHFLPTAHAHAHDGGELLLYGADGQLQSWCCRYGVVGSTWSSQTLSRSTGKNKAPRGSAALSHDDDAMYCLCGPVMSPILFGVRRSESGSSLFRVTLNGGVLSARSGLAGALGSLRNSTDESQLPLMIQLFSEAAAAADSDVADTEKSPMVSSRGALGVLPRPLKRKLQNAALWRSKRDVSEEDHNETVVVPNNEDSRSVRPSVPLEASSAFLRAMHGRSSGDVLASDWDVLLTLLTTHRCVSVQMPNNSDMIDLAMKAGRLDVLCCLGRYAPDLTEFQAVQALVQLANWNAESSENRNVLRCLRLGPTGALLWAPQPQLNAVLQGGSSTPNAKKKSKTAPTPAPISSSDDVKCLSHLDVLCALSESLLRRHASFSAALLADAARELVPSSVAALLLRVFTRFLRGLSAVDTSKSVVFQGFVHDAQVCRAVTWCEALLDAHFCDAALSLGTGKGALALESALREAEVVLPPAGVESGAAMTEQAIGTWTHIYRTLRTSKDRASASTSASHGVGNLSPPEGPYRLERVVF